MYCVSNVTLTHISWLGLTLKRALKQAYHTVTSCVARTYSVTQEWWVEMTYGHSGGNQGVGGNDLNPACTRVAASSGDTDPPVA